MPADAVFLAGRAYGITAGRRIHRAVAVEDGRIAAVHDPDGLPGAA
jgi:predicted amidohydrolase YtcJ